MIMSDRLKGKVAIVTGAGRGIGKGEAIALAEEGARVVVNDLGGGPDGAGTSKSPADEVVEDIKKMGGESVANYDSVATSEGRLDILVNNAGILRDKMIFNMSEEEWDIVIKVHLYGHFYTTRYACPIFREQRSGRIINTSSTSAFGVTFGQSNYGAAKEGIIGLTRTVAKDMGKYGVTCNALRPGAASRLTLSDEMRRVAKERGREDRIKAMEESMKPEDIAPLVVWLCSDDAAHVNGRTFNVRTGKISLYSEPIEEKSLYKDGSFTVDELFNIMPSSLAQGLINPAPPQD
jgi:NAD(P)-dependent dehydrogenase (short-subunit alcohol dehydrogenase family)